MAMAKARIYGRKPQPARDNAGFSMVSGGQNNGGQSALIRALSFFCFIFIKKMSSTADNVTLVYQNVKIHYKGFLFHAYILNRPADVCAQLPSGNPGR
ncbi:hypothetical protein [Gibbsiella quercinecans]|uniref:hypothetical protein n=1 Tax=Gibbsiella quercinecans TaxID=929813 RepID=UPI0011C34ED3|nr:hypothetical protein [Gibbsiella quercinecans]